MTVQTMTWFFTLLAVLCEMFVFGAIIVALAGKSSRASFADTVAPVALWLAAGIGVVTMLGSLYLSEVAHFVPCKLCWYQRIAAYPLAVILPVAAWRNDRSVRKYVWPLCFIGSAISIWHILIENYPTLSGSSSCDPNNPCAVLWVHNWWITIPRMALSSFLVIAVLVGIEGARQARPSSSENQVSA